MNLHVKTVLTLAVLAVLLLVGVAYGWSSLTQPFPHQPAAKACYPDRLQPGDSVSPPKVLVSVYNASTRGGLAESTLAAFESAGFGAGQAGNAPKNTVVHYAQIWTKHPRSPDVQLVKSRLGPNAAVVTKKYGGPGVVVMVGPLFSKLVPGQQSIKVTKSTTICSPPTG